MTTEVLPELLRVGSDGVVIFLVWSLMKQNQKLITEVNSRDNELMKLIYKILSSEQRGTRSERDRTIKPKPQKSVRTWE
ncbi:hypothetical protein [Limnospira platensis]|uniref:hypothetical protein n=1 Tax=Limnospira platensis TaxID=118562 RepID=UPI0001D0EBF9|nr:hypothetical protein AP285_16395 [Arthrospira platensis YZ]KDR58612.1 hypothetical protein APPUASWS_004015 [Arthrospira platensis str. Paraca]MDF2213196.1 hypothetical protein [Arthrospira platensis NCB002]QQW27172.1 hypothetical protein AP9108_17825 [Arthrospira sp. PCC 9108]BAI91543.1 hypothetical protein NIES39_J04970 [Arthrospira platensis NIES-39]